MTRELARDQLRHLVERIERLDKEIEDLNGDKKDIYTEARSNGYEVKALKEVIRQRRKKPGEVAEFESLVDIYKAALGMLPDSGTPVATRAHTAPEGREAA